MIFNIENRDDIKKYYNKAIVKFPEKTGDRLWRITEINFDYVKCTDVDGFQVLIDLHEDYEVEYPLPGRTVYQHGERAAMLIRKPARQYMRGISESNTTLMHMDHTGTWRSMELSLKNLQQFVDKPCYQNINTINWESMQSAALSKHMAVSRDGKIMLLHRCVGHFNPETKQYTIHPLFMKEAEELFVGWSKK